MSKASSKQAAIKKGANKRNVEEVYEDEDLKDVGINPKAAEPAKKKLKAPPTLKGKEKIISEDDDELEESTSFNEQPPSQHAAEVRTAVEAVVAPKPAPQLRSMTLVSSLVKPKPLPALGFGIRAAAASATPLPEKEKNRKTRDGFEWVQPRDR